MIGFRPGWNPLEKLSERSRGRLPVTRAVLGHEMETIAYETLHKERGVTNGDCSRCSRQRPAGGCSVAIHTAAGLAKSFPKNVLLIEGDRRSGVYSIMLNLDGRQGLDNALALGNSLTPGEWHQHVARIDGFHLLPANRKRESPCHRGRTIIDFSIRAEAV